MNQPPPFYARVEAAVRAMTEAVAADVPELEAVACVCLWRLPGQLEVPSVFVVPAGGALDSPDQFLRLLLASLTLPRHCLDRGEAGVVAVRELVRRLATEGLAHVPTPGSPPTPPAPATPGGPADAGHVGDVA